MAEWAKIIGFDGYFASDAGEIGSTKPRNKWSKPPVGYRVLKSIPDKDGYLQVHLFVGGASHTKKIHRLVLEAFVGPCPDGFTCRHLDGNPANNALTNLQWSDHSTNSLDKRVHGTMCRGDSHRQRGRDCARRGEEHHNSILTNDQAVEIFTIAREGRMPQARIARLFGVGQSTVSAILNGKSYGVATAAMRGASE